MKKFIAAIIAFFIVSNYYSQCLKPISLNQKINNSSVVVEGKVISKTSFWDNDHKMIYTSNKIEVSRIFKGSITGNYIEVITKGGTVGLNRISANPELSLNINEIGVFSCIPTKTAIPFANVSSTPQFDAYASVQGFIKYDTDKYTASTPFDSYNSIINGVYTAITAITQKPFQTINNIKFIPSKLPSIQSDPVIDNFSPMTTTAGTQTTLTINGAGFGSTRGGGNVQFANADDGGSTTILPLSSQYISWTNTQIKVKIPAGAGTGAIGILTNAGGNGLSTQTLTISYATQNVEYEGDAYTTDHIDNNGSGGYTWHMNTGFDANTMAKASFMRAFDTWRCHTGVNWTIGMTTSTNDAVADEQNVICFDNDHALSEGVLGVCYSYWLGCASGQTIVWYVAELDIIFDNQSNMDGLTWQYGPSDPSNMQYDFETVAVHELGHGHQLGHVIKPGAIMHYAISNGTKNRILSANDLAGGNFVQAKSLVGNVCGPGAMTNYTGCGAIAPVAGFTVSANTICNGGSVVFTDQSTNVPTKWAWQFKGGTPATSTVQNPTVTYNTAGIYGVTLTATNTGGSDAEKRGEYITVNICYSVTNFTVSTRTICRGNNVINFTDMSSNTPTAWNWKFQGGTPSTSTVQNPAVTYAVAGTYSVSLTTSNSFGSNTKVQKSYITVVACDAKLLTNYCGTTLNLLNTVISCNTVPGATNYQFRVVGPTSYTITGASSFNIGNLPGILYGTTYNVNVRTYKDGMWSSFGDVCSITTPNSASMPLTKLMNVYCGGVMSSNSIVYCALIPGVNKYQFRVVGPNSYTVISTANALKLGDILGIQDNTPYSIDVRTFAGGSWSAFGDVCVVTTPDFIGFGKMTIGSNSSQNDDVSLNVYPNPVKDGNIFIEFPGINSKQTFDIAIYNLIGSIVYEEKNIQNEVTSVNINKLSAATYIMRIIYNDSVYYRKVIVE